MDQLNIAASLSAHDLFEILRDIKQELALLDVREEGRFGDGHIIVASSLPLSRLEPDIARLVPRISAPIILCDDDDGLAARARDRLNALGYTNITLLEGGMPAWRAAGYALYDGLNTPSKALGVYMHRELAIPEIQPDELAGLIDADGNLAILDCRPFSEYKNGTIPGSINCPGAALAVHACTMGEEADILVVHCAGRTRGLAGVQTLIDNGFAGRVVALRDGTMGWQLSGRTTEKGANRRQFSSPIPSVAEPGLARAEAIRAMANIRLVDPATLETMRADANRTTYVFDIREMEEYAAGHMAGARHVAGGQLVQNLDMHAAIQGARLVVSDNDGVQASSTALWLRRMGCRDVSVARLLDGGHSIVTDAATQKPDIASPSCVRTVSAARLRELLANTAANIIDLGSSRNYRKGHVPGAWFIVRSRLAQLIGKLPPAENLVLTSEDGELARYAAQDHIPFRGDIFVLEGGTNAWRNAGYELSTSIERLLDVTDDVFPKPTELPDGPARDEAMRVYLAGSEELLAQVEREGILKFSALPVA